MIKSFLSIFVIICFISCNENKKNNSKTSDKKTQSKVDLKKDTIQDSVLLSLGLYYVTNINPDILYDLKYTYEDNFLSKKLYTKIKKPYLQREVAIRLSNCQFYLDSIKPGFKLLIYDAVRPVSVQKIMWNSMDSLPPKIRKRYVSPPTSRSLHNYGAAVDITLVNENGVPLDMGAQYDEFNKIAYPRLEQHFFKNGKLTSQQYENRKLLRQVMNSQNFKVLSTEWWHFNACTKKYAKRNYKLLLKE